MNYQCTAMDFQDPPVTFTIWQGSAFNCPSASSASNNRITLSDGVDKHIIYLFIATDIEQLFRDFNSSYSLYLSPVLGCIQMLMGQDSRQVS